MSIAASPPASGTAGRDDDGADLPSASPPVEPCPLCGSPLHPEQDWCLRCGGAARTRLAASPNWKAPTATLAVVLALSLGVLAAALVKLAGGSGTGATPVTRTVTAARAAIVSTPTATIPTATAPTASPPRTKTSGTPARIGTSTVPSFKSPAGTLGRKRHIHLSPAAEKLLLEFQEPHKTK
jgi:hypothetical protein